MADIRKRRKAHVAKEQCVACGCCVRGCPVGAIEVVRGLFARVNQGKCVGCGRCAGECPASVIALREEAL
ncbi:MAG TPA: 4Fe-4S binding protein [Candidatus Limiplasma pullicola]|nr:4Fe-4S binding protein [Candidatus Limiplasma pullicola]